MMKIETERVLSRRQKQYGVIDIGSNSVRLVVYDSLSRAPFPRFNEKSLCALGSGIDENGNFSKEVISRVLHTVKRMVSIASAMNVERIDVFATEATRRANNGAQLVEAIEEFSGLKTRILSGREEARYAAFGVLAGFYRPYGLVGDIGGGSLEIAQISGDRVEDNLTSMLLGALPVGRMMEAGFKSAKKAVDGILENKLPRSLSEPVLYAVGGGWRALARVHIALTKDAGGVVHAYDIDANELKKLAKKISKMTPGEVRSLPDVPGRRIATLPAAALVMQRLLRFLKPERVVFSSYGVREGWLYTQLDHEEQQRDPLLEGAQAIGLPHARVPAFCAALARWTEYLFPDESETQRRIRLSVCALTDIAWRDHTKIRSHEIFHRLLGFPFIGISHKERAFLALAIRSRYGGKCDDMVRATIGNILSAQEATRAEILGRALLLGHRFSGSVPEILEQSRLHIEKEVVRLMVSSCVSTPDSDAVHERLKQLAAVAGLKRFEIAEASSSDC